MKTAVILTLATSLAVAGPAVARHTTASPASVKTGRGTGVVTALDPKTAKVTIGHAPIPALGWPAMTMTFEARPPALIRGLHVGQKIGFDVQSRGMTAEVTAIRVR